MLALILQFLGGSFITTLVNGALNAYKAKIEAMGTREAHEVDLAKAEILGEIALRQEATKVTLAEQGRWYTALIRPAFAYPLAFYYTWVILSCVFHWPMPISLPYPVGDWSGWIISSYFVGRSFEKIARIWRR
jgi:hypothetical protein